MIELIAFLGNPGKKYEYTRHNVAWIFSNWADISASVSWQQKFKGLYSKIPSSMLNGRIVHLLKPETFMNLSGESVNQAASFFKLKPEQILIVHDELEIKPATISFKWSGGLGGHNGLRSIKSIFGTADFFRLRIGIGRPDFSDQGGDSKPDISGFVLSRFSQPELNLLKTQIPNINKFFQEILFSDNPTELIKKWSKILPENK